MGRGKFIIRDGKLVPYEEREVTECHQIITDSMNGTWHPADGKTYDSKSAFRRTTKNHNCVELGDQAPNPETFKKEVRKSNVKEELIQTFDKVVNGKYRY